MLMSLNIKKNITITLIGTIIRLALPMVLLPFLNSTLNLIELSFYLMVYSYLNFVALIDLGIGSYFLKKISIGLRDIEIKKYWHAFSVIIIPLSFGVSLACIILVHVKYGSEIKLIGYIASFVILLCGMLKASINNLYNATFRHFQFTLVNVFVSLFVASTTYFLAIKNVGIESILATTALLFVLELVLLMYVMSPSISFRHLFRVKYISAVFSVSKSFFSVSLISLTIIQLDRLVVNFFGSYNDVVSYLIAVNLAIILIAITSFSNKLALPYFNKLYNEDESSFSIVFTAFCLCLIVLFLFINIGFKSFGGEAIGLWLDDKTLTRGVYDKMIYLIPAYSFFCLSSILYIFNFATNNLSFHFKILSRYLIFQFLLILLGSIFYIDEIQVFVFFHMLLYFIFVMYLLSKRIVKFKVIPKFVLACIVVFFTVGMVNNFLFKYLDSSLKVFVLNFSLMAFIFIILITFITKRIIKI